MKQISLKNISIKQATRLNLPQRLVFMIKIVGGIVVSC